MVYDGIQRALVTPCRISLPDAGEGPAQEFQAIWDTGATGVVVTRRVLESCGLLQTGWAYSYHVGSEEPERVPTFEADVYLPNMVCCPAVTVIPGHISDSVDVLIGMEIIARGDFAITCPQGNTKFTFRIPHQADLDFAAVDS